VLTQKQQAEIREACDRLFNRVITITTEAGTFKTRWVQDIMKYNSDWALANPEFIQEVTGSDPYAEDYILAAIRFSKSVLPLLVTYHLTSHNIFFKT
jgi:hypothetical protein